MMLKLIMYPDVDKFVFRSTVFSSEIGLNIEFETIR